MTTAVLSPVRTGVAGTIALMVAHCAGMVDLVALPVWVGTLVGSYGFSPQQAGGLATVFLLGAVASSLFFAPRFNRISGRVAAAAGFGGAALAFGFAATTTAYPMLMAAHLVAGVSAGCALSFTHGTIGRSANPHRLFAVVGLAMGAFALVFLAATPNLVASMGGAVLFQVFGGVMAVASIVAALMFPKADAESAASLAAAKLPIPRAVWFGVFGVVCMALNQAMVFSYFEVIGRGRGFAPEAVIGVLIALGFVNLVVPAPLAAVLQGKVAAEKVVIFGPVAQAALAVTFTVSTAFIPFAAAGAVFVALMIFTHTFAFGMLARMDTSGRALAGTPAMLMAGAAVGPILGGILVQNLGFPALGAASVVVACVAIASFLKARTA